MQTPNNNAGRLTEQIMRVFWGDQGIPKLETAHYNKAYTHVYNTLINAEILYSVPENDNKLEVR